MRKLILIAFIGLTVVACNKNQQAVKTLDGKWKATSYLVTDGVDSEDFLLTFGISYEMEFQNCKLKKEETCDVTETTADNESADIENGQYKVIDDGNKLELIGDNKKSTIYTIEELEDSKLVLILTELGLTATITMVKQ